MAKKKRERNNTEALCQPQRGVKAHYIGPLLLLLLLLQLILLLILLLLFLPLFITLPQTPLHPSHPMSDVGISNGSISF